MTCLFPAVTLNRAIHHGIEKKLILPSSYLSGFIITDWKEKKIVSTSTFIEFMHDLSEGIKFSAEGVSATPNKDPKFASNTNLVFKKKRSVNCIFREEVDGNVYLSRKWGPIVSNGVLISSFSFY